MSFCPSANSENQTVALQWNGAALQGIRDAKLGAPAVARALAIVRTCVYDAWTAYDERGVGTQLPLEWETFTDAANEAGLSHHYGGIHFRAADLPDDCLAVSLLGKHGRRRRATSKASH